MVFQIDYDRLYDAVGQMHYIFKAAKPFPNISISNFLDDPSLAYVLEEFPVKQGQKLEDLDPKIWKMYENEHTEGKLVTRATHFKCKDIALGSLRRILQEFNSALFLRFLEGVTGIEGLIGDPFFREAGLHCILPGGRLDSHTDFTHHQDLGLERRGNFFLYLSEDWKEEYGGALSLYDLEGNEVAKHYPMLNHAVIFEASDISFHGHPEPLKCPDGMMRKSIAMYYYTAPTGREPKRIVFQ